mgnify:CR=1 FL=1
MYEYSKATEAGRRMAGAAAAEAEQKHLREIQMRVVCCRATPEDIKHLGELLARSPATLEGLIQNREQALDSLSRRLIKRRLLHAIDSRECRRLAESHPESWQWLTEAHPDEFPVEGE